MSLPPSPSEQTGGPAAPGPGGDAEVAVDVGAFLPDGVELTADEVPADEAPAESTPEASGSSEVSGSSEAPGSQDRPVDVAALDQLERDLDGVDAAIARLDDGTYGLDPATGEPIDDALPAEDPTRRT